MQQNQLFLISGTSEAGLEMGLCFQLVLLMSKKVQAPIQACEGL